jgi:hypothetical protein
VRDLAAAHEIPERDHQRVGRLLEHLDDDDAIVEADKSTRRGTEWHGGELEAVPVPDRE